MCEFAEEFEACLEGEVGGEERKCYAVAEGEHAGVFFACCGLAGEEGAGVDGEGAYEGEAGGEWDVWVVPFVEGHHNYGDEGEAAAAYAYAGVAAEGAHVLG